ncbi:MAG: domain containing protein [Marmoricola sp.]|nr:domain containing protein [Marmoricola sp.]
MLLAPAADASVSTLCTSYVGCATLGMGHAGYATASRTMYWNMYAGHNCTNYAAYRMIQAGMPNRRPWTGSGNATNWGSAMSRITDSTPAVGAVAWWRAGVKPAGSAGHVAYVEKVVSPDEILVSQDSWNGDFSWTRVTRTSSGWPSGFVHFTDGAATTPTPTPTPPTPAPTPTPGPSSRTSLSAPVITGTPQVGRTLSATTGTWSPAPAGVTYAWLVDGTPVPGSTRSTFSPATTRVGHVVSVRVTATGSGLSPVSRTSAATAPVSAGVLPVSGTAQVTGTTSPGSRLHLSLPTVPQGTAAAVTWNRDGRAIGGATGRDLTLGTADLGHRISTVVRLTRAGYQPVTLTTPGSTLVRTASRIAVTAVGDVRSLRVSATVTRQDGVTPAGTFVVRSRGRVLARVPVTAGRASVVVPDTTGTHRYRFRFLTSPTVMGSELLRNVAVR